MSEENVAVYRAFYDAWNAGDMERVRDLYDVHAVVRGPKDWPEAGPWIGADAIMRQWEQQRDTWDADWIEPVGDFVDAADRVVVRFVWRGRGRGPDLDAEFTGVVTLRNGKIVLHEVFRDHAEALKLLGLTE